MEGIKRQFSAPPTLGPLAGRLLQRDSDQVVLLLPCCPALYPSCDPSVAPGGMVAPGLAHPTSGLPLAGDCHRPSPGCWPIPAESPCVGSERAELPYPLLGQTQKPGAATREPPLGLAGIPSLAALELNRRCWAAGVTARPPAC